MSYIPRLKRKTKMTLVVFGCVACFAGSLPTEAESGAVMASWYGAELAGSPTASGEPYDPSGLTAAHKTLPMGTMLRVCNDTCTSVRVNDRGPYTAGRDLDLSAAAAQTIGVEGVEPVEIEQAAPDAVIELPKTGGVNALLP